MGGPFGDHVPQDEISRLARKKRMAQSARHRRQHPPVKRVDREDGPELGYEVEHDYKSADEDRP